MNNSRLLYDSTLERPDSPTFTCEVCKISVRSAQKLLDHVNFSPLHKAALEGGGSRPDDRLLLGASSSPKVSHQRRVIYDGTKLFWRINETLELCIYEDVGANCVTITAFQQQSNEKLAPIQIDLRSLLKVLGLEDHKLQMLSHNAQTHNTYAPELLSKYLLARVQAKKDPRGYISLFLAKVHEHEALPALLMHGTFHHMPTDLAVRRRHTMDDVKEAQKEVQDAAVELKKARVQAEQLSNLARISLEAFSKRGAKQQQQPELAHHSHSPHSEWLRVYDRVATKNAVEHSKGFLYALEKR